MPGTQKEKEDDLSEICDMVQKGCIRSRYMNTEQLRKALEEKQYGI